MSMSPPSMAASSAWRSRRSCMRWRRSSAPASSRASSMAPWRRATESLVLLRPRFGRCCSRASGSDALRGPALGPPQGRPCAHCSSHSGGSHPSQLVTSWPSPSFSVGQSLRRTSQPGGLHHSNVAALRPDRVDRYGALCAIDPDSGPTHSQSDTRRVASAIVSDAHRPPVPPDRRTGTSSVPLRPAHGTRGPAEVPRSSRVHKVALLGSACTR